MTVDRPASGPMFWLSAAGELHVMECRVDLAARAQPLRVLGGDGRTVGSVVDLGEELDGPAVCAVARLVRAERIVCRTDDAQRVRALHAVHGKRLLRDLRELERVLGGPVGEHDA